MAIPNKNDSMEAIPPRSSNARLDDPAEPDERIRHNSHCFTPASDSKLTIVEQEEVKSPAELMDFNDIGDQPPDSLDPAVAVMA